MMEWIPEPPAWAWLWFTRVSVAVGLGFVAHAMLLAWRRRDLLVPRMSRHEKGSGLILLTFGALDIYLWVPEIGWGAVVLFSGASLHYVVRTTILMGDAGRIGYLWGEERPPRPDEEA